MSSGSEVLADSLFDALLVGESFDTPTVNLDDPAFVPPSIVDNPLYQKITELSNEDLTTRAVGGSGTYDAIMESQSIHLKAEYTAGRITGAEYTKAYIALSGNAVSQGVQFLLGKDQAYWASVNAQMQALTARVQLETAKVQLAISLIEVKNQKATFALNKIRLANEDAQYGIAKYNLENTLPAQKLLLDDQHQQITQQTTNLQAELLNIPKQGSLIDANKNVAIQQELNLEDDLLTNAKQRLKIDQDTLLVTEQKDMVILQQEGQTQSNLAATYNVTDMLPEQKKALIEQIEAARAQTMDTRQDGVTTVTGSIGKQKALYSQQIDSYKRSSELNVAKLYTDYFAVNKSIDEGFTALTSMDSVNTNSIITNLRTKVGIDV